MTLVMSCGYNVAETSCNIWPQTYLLMFLGRSMRGRGGMRQATLGVMFFARSMCGGGGGGWGGAGNCLSMKSVGDLVAQLMLARWLLLSEDACMTLVMSCGYNVAETSCNIWPQTRLLMFLGRSMCTRRGVAGTAGRVDFCRKHVRWGGGVGGAGNCLSMKSVGDLVAQLMLAR